MEADTEPTLDVETGLVEHRAVWRLAAGVLGLSFWAQLFWYPLVTEFLAETTGGLFVGVYMLPVAVLAVSLVVGSSAGLLFGLPVALLPGLLIVPEQDAASLLELHRGLILAGTVLAYLVAAAIATRPADIDPTDKQAIDEESRRVDGLYRHYVTIRLVILVGLFGVLVGSVVFDPTIRSLIADNHGDGRLAAQLFIAVLGFFTWCAVAYTMFYMPLANIEYEMRSFSREIDAMAGDGSRIRWRLGLTVAAGLAVAAVWFLWGLVGV